MDKEQRKQLLKRLSVSSEGEALKDLLKERISALTDSRKYKADDFEMEGKSSLKAVTVLEKVLRDLELLKRKKGDRGQNQYV